MLRARLLRALRGFFERRGFLEVTTPTRVGTPALEDYIDAVPAGNCWLRTSPELHMKRLVQMGAGRIYQLGPCFRAGEHGRRHRPEFTMLEWYQARADYLDVLVFVRELVIAAAEVCRIDSERRRRLSMEWERLTVDDAFRRYAGTAAAEALAAGRFEELLVTRVEPDLGRAAPTVLIDYPIALGALARAKPTAPELAERWELYIDGIEVANAYSELVDPDEQRRRFTRTAQLRAADGRDVYGMDEAFLAAMDAGMPPMAGCALGVDRLHMALVGATEIATVLTLE